jgi:ribosomal-protein-alanine N-acetyltransferase
MPRMSIIETPRLVLRSWKAEDAPALLRIYSDPEVTRHIPHVSMTELVAAQAKVRQMQELEEKNGCTLWAVLREGELIGVCGFREKWELGFAFARGAWGKGYAREAAQACLDWGRQNGMERVIAVTRPENAGSRALLEKLGFADSGDHSNYVAL